MKMHLTHRTARKASELKRLRHEGLIPAVLYAKGDNSIPVALCQSEFEKLLRDMKKGMLATTVLSVELDGVVHRVLVKGIEYHRVTYNVLHIDLMRLDDRKEVCVRVPLFPINVEECPGVKLGGSVKVIQRAIKVKCDANALPSFFEIDVSDVGLKQSKRIRDLKVPAGVRVCGSDKEVIVTVGK